MSVKVFTCNNCGWSGIPFRKHSFVKNSHGATLHIKSLVCGSCDHELVKESEEVDKVSDISKEDISEIPVKSIDLPYTFKTDKYRLEIKADEFIIENLTSELPFGDMKNFKGECKVECFGEVFYEAVIKMTNGFNLEFRIPESQIDCFCEFFLKHYEAENPVKPQSLPKFPPPFNPNKIPNKTPWDPNSIPWIDPNKIPTPYYPTYPKKKIDPYGETEDKKKWIDEIGKLIREMNDYKKTE